MLLLPFFSSTKKFEVVEHGVESVEAAWKSVCWMSNENHRCAIIIFKNIKWKSAKRMA